MKRRPRINLILLIAVATLALLVYLSPDEPGFEVKLPPLTDLSPDAVTRVSIRNESGEMIFERQAEGWNMISPKQAAAKAERLDALVRVAETPVFSNYPLPTSRRLKEFGLDPANIILTLNDIKIEFGTVESLSQNRYVRIGDQIYLIGDGFYHHLVAKAEDFH